MPQCKTEPFDIPVKKTKLMDDAYLMDYHQYHSAFIYQYRQLSAFRPWAQISSKHFPQHFPYPGNIPYLSQEPPILQNPERVVRSSESERFERSYQPNVALAPRKLNSLTNNNINNTSSSTTTTSIAPSIKERDRSRIVITPDIQIKQERPCTPVEVISSPELRVESPINSVSPISPEGLSGSNEITSSTSPIPNQNHKCNDAVSPSPQNSMPIENHIILNHRRQQQSSPMILQNGNAAIMGNPEFELSTDTDDDSLTGEPDSSNTGTNGNAPWDMAADIMKDVSSDVREKVVNLFRVVVRDNIECNLEKARMAVELRRKEEQLTELLRQQQHWEQQQRRHQLQLSPIESTVHILSKTENNTDKIDIIMKPLKKSARRSPDDSVVILQKIKREDELIIDPPKESITRLEVISPNFKINEDVKHSECG